MLDVPPGHVVGGVDTHKDVHVAAVVDHLGRLLATESFPATTAGYRHLSEWLARRGRLVAVGVEGTSSWGAGLARFLTGRGVRVLEVNRPDRRTRRARGKSDPIDAEAAARAVLAGHTTAIPKSGDGVVEAIRVLRVARRSAMKARVQTGNQIKSLIDTAPDRLRSQLRDLTTAQACARIARMRVGEGRTLAEITKKTLVGLARRWQRLEQEIAGLDADLDALVGTLAPALLALPGVGTDSAGALLIAVGDNPDRLGTEAAFAALCGVSPIPASSGRTQRHRLNRGGDRAANQALWRIVLVRMRWHPPTRAYVARRTAEGLSPREIIRCLKRFTARAIYRLLRQHGLLQPA